MPVIHAGGIFRQIQGMHVNLLNLVLLFMVESETNIFLVLICDRKEKK